MITEKRTTRSLTFGVVSYKTGSPSYAPSAVTEVIGLWICSSGVPTIELSPISLLINSAARISFVSGLIAK